MSNLMCKDCKSTDVTAYTPNMFGDSRHRCNSCGKISVTANFVEPTLFNRITQSPEALTEKLVYPKGEKLCCIGTDHRYEYKMMWGSVLLPGITFEEYAEAYLSTLNKLKEVEKDEK